MVLSEDCFLQASGVLKSQNSMAWQIVKNKEDRIQAVGKLGTLYSVCFIPFVLPLKERKSERKSVR